MGEQFEGLVISAKDVILCHMVNAQYDVAGWVDGSASWEAAMRTITNATYPALNGLNLSHAQFGGALALAVKDYRKGNNNAVRV